MSTNIYEYIKKHYPNVTVVKATDSGKIIRVVTEKSNITLDTAKLNVIKVDMILKYIL